MNVHEQENATMAITQLKSECVRLRAELAEQEATLYLPCVERGGCDNPEVIEVVECHDKMAAELVELRTAAQAVVDSILHPITGMVPNSSLIPTRMGKLESVRALAGVLERGNQ